MTKIPRNHNALRARQRNGGPMKHRNTPRGGARNDQADLLEDAIVEIADATPTIPSGRLATCGACGCERLVDAYMVRNESSQYTARPAAGTDLFYCGCQNDDEYWDF